MPDHELPQGGVVHLNCGKGVVLWSNDPGDEDCGGSPSQSDWPGRCRWMSW